MNAPRSSRRATAVVIVRSVLWLWLVGLSVWVFLGHQAMNDLADRERVDTGLKRLDTQIAGLVKTTQALQEQPAAATVAGLQDTRQALETRIAQIEQALGDRATTDDLQALRTEIEQIKARQVAQAATPAQSSATKPAAAPSVPAPLPFRIVGIELRAGQRSVSVAPASGDFSTDQVQVLLPGDAIGAWRLQTIDGNTAVLQAGKQTRRVTIP